MPFHSPLCRRLSIVFLTLFLTAQLLIPYSSQAFLFGGVSIKDEKEMGHKFDLMLRSSMGIVDDPEVRQYVDHVLRRLVKATSPQPFEFKASVVLHNSLNAFAVPGGFVYIFTGLIMHLNKEEELAGVLAHELAHVTQRHVASRLERAQFLTLGSLLLAIAGVAAGGPGGSTIAAGAIGAGQSAMLNYSRMDETEADQIGLQYLVAAGYPPVGMIDGFKVLRQKSRINGGNVPTYLSTHPAIGDRINGLAARIQGMDKSVLQRTQDNTRFVRVQTLLWARYGDSQAALQRFAHKGALSSMGRGIVLARLNRVNEANKAFDEALAIAPSDPLVLREAGIFHYRKGDMNRSEALLDAALRHDTHDYMAAFFYARLLDDSGRHTRAFDHYKEVLRHVPEDSEVHEAFARALGKAGDTLNAYIHMTYSSLYANDKKQTERYFSKAKALAGHAADRRTFQRLENAYKDRKEIWEKH
ncbi:MAG: M48 family metalloprotease [Desulfovibrio sp.]|nr:M48 family metalloprotease [Desulfovibrio sp.]